MKKWHKSKNVRLHMLVFTVSSKQNHVKKFLISQSIAKLMFPPEMSNALWLSSSLSNPISFIFCFSTSKFLVGWGWSVGACGGWKEERKGFCDPIIFEREGNKEGASLLMTSMFSEIELIAFITFGFIISEKVEGSKFDMILKGSDKLSPPKFWFKLVEDWFVCSFPSWWLESHFEKADKSGVLSRPRPIPEEFVGLLFGVVVGLEFPHGSGIGSPDKFCRTWSLWRFELPAGDSS